MKVKFLGATDDQANWGSGEDPRKYLTVGQEYTLVHKEVHSYHTLYYVDGFNEGFNSVCFEEVVMVKDHVRGTVRFSHYRDKTLFYKTDTGLLFPIPIEEVGNATFLAEDKSLLFMRWIRRHLDFLKSGIPF